MYLFNIYEQGRIWVCNTEGVLEKYHNIRTKFSQFWPTGLFLNDFEGLSFLARPLQYATAYKYL